MNFKESKIPGVGLIPSHWIESKWRYVTDILTDYTANGSFGDLAKNVTYLNEPDYARLIRLTDLRTNLENEGLYVNKHSYDYLKKSALYGGEFLIANVGANAGLVLEMPKLDVRATLGPNMMLARFDFNKVLSKYMLYIANSEYIQTQLILKATASSAQPKLNKEDFRSIQFLLPPMDEQERIVRYLDGKLPDVDTIIRKLNKKISLLEQQRQSIITEAVTKGLNPNVKMKDSGVEWIGEIPEYWELSKIGYLGRLQNGISKSSEEFGFGTPFISYGDVYKNEVLPKNASGLVNATEEDKKLYSVNYGDVFFTRTSETIEEIGFASTCLETIPDATFAGFLIRFRPTTNRLNPYFSRFYFRSALGKRYFVKEMNLVTRASLAQGLLRNFTVVLPSLEEQEDIAVYLENKTTAIEESIALIKAQIEKLKEYRQALIYEAVTGKIDVRDMELD